MDRSNSARIRRATHGLLAFGFTLVILAALVAAFPLGAWAASGEANAQGEISAGNLTVSELNDFGGVLVKAYDEGDYSGASFRYYYPDTVRATITVADPSIADVEESGGYYIHYPVVRAKKLGVTTITVSCGEDSVSFPLLSVPNYDMVPTSVEKASFDSVRVSWDPIPNVTGYKIARELVTDGYDPSVSYETVGSVRGDATASAIVKAPWLKTYRYLVVPYVTYEGKTYCLDDSSLWGSSASYALPKASLTLGSVTQAPNALKLSWKAESGVGKFDVYRSTKPDRGFKKIASTKSKTYTDKKVTAGTTYYYKVSGTYPGVGSLESNSYAFTAGKTAKFASSTLKGVQADMGGYNLWGGNSTWNWTTPDGTYYYSQGSKLYVVCYDNKKLRVMGFDAKLKKVSQKIVKLPRHDLFGGFYHGTDDNNYVVVGYKNLKESKTKTVIKVIQFNKSWKQGKTGLIKGGASNSFEGIYIPFEGGTVSFDMQGSKLYVFTCREMFATSDGLHHQSNFAFSVNTKNMQTTVENYVYTSHSFNQKVRLKDGSIYLADHGDAYPRSMALTASGFGTSEDAMAEPSWKVGTLDILGEMGNNFTGATLGGLEVGVNKVLMCGTSQPQGYKVSGVTGLGDLRKNAFLTVTDRATGRSQVKWLTTFNPKTSKKEVGETRMVKVSEDRYAVLFDVSGTSKYSTNLNCVMVNANGKKLSTKTYKNVRFTGKSQPVLYDGCICWMDRTYDDSGRSVLYKVPIP